MLSAYQQYHGVGSQTVSAELSDTYWQLMQTLRSHTVEWEWRLGCVDVPPKKGNIDEESKDVQWLTADIRQTMHVTPYWDVGPWTMLDRLLFEDPDFEKTADVHDTEEWCYPGGVRHIKDGPSASTHCKRSIASEYHMSGAHLALSTETVCEEPESEQQATSVRIKTRHSYTWKELIRVDFTKAKVYKAAECGVLVREHGAPVRHEVELELIDMEYVLSLPRRSTAWDSLMTVWVTSGLQTATALKHAQFHQETREKHVLE